MLNIDLIPDDLHHYKPHTGPYCVAVGVGVVVAMLLSWSLIELPLIRSRCRKAEGAFRAMQEAWAIYRNAPAEAAKLESAGKSLVASALEISQATAGRVEVSPIMRELAAILPPAIWLKGLSLDFEAGTGTLSCSAWGGLHEDECTALAEALGRIAPLVQTLGQPRLGEREAASGDLSREVDFAVGFDAGEAERGEQGGET